MKEQRITVNPTVMGGVPCIRNTRIPVATIMESLAQSVPAERIVESYPDLDLLDIQAALEFAATAVQERQIPLLAS